MIRESVLRGLAENPALPVGVLGELLEKWPSPVARGLAARAELPRELQERMAGHELREVRRAVATSPAVDPDIRGRLATDPDWRVRLAEFGQFGGPQRPLTGEALTRAMPLLVKQPDEGDLTLSEWFGELLWEADDGVRDHIATHAYLTENEQAVLDRERDLDPSLLTEWARSENHRLRQRAAQHPQLPAAMIPVLADDPNAHVRADLDAAANPALDWRTAMAGALSPGP